MDLSPTVTLCTGDLDLLLRIAPLDGLLEAADNALATPRTGSGLGDHRLVLCRTRNCGRTLPAPLMGRPVLGMLTLNHLEYVSEDK